MNIRSALLHEVGDTLSTAAVIVGGWAILVTDNYWIDSALSFGIGALILWSGFGIVRETLNILLEGTPRGVKLELVETAIRSIDGVNDVHDLHCWSIGSETRALSCHISIADIPPSVSERILRDVKDLSASRLPHRPHDDSVRARGMRSGAWLRDSGGRERAGTPPQPLEAIDCPHVVL